MGRHIRPSNYPTRIKGALANAGSVVSFWRRHQNSRDSNLALLSSEKSIGCTYTNDTSLNLRASCCQRNFSHLVRFAVSSLIIKERKATHRIRQSLKHPWVQRSFQPFSHPKMLYMPKKSNLRWALSGIRTHFREAACTKNLVNTHRQLSIDHQDGTEVATFSKESFHATRRDSFGSVTWNVMNEVYWSMLFPQQTIQRRVRAYNPNSPLIIEEKSIACASG